MSEKLHEALDTMTREMEGLREDFRKGVNSNSSRIEVNAGGLGVWISTVACAVMVGISLIGVAVIVDQNRRIGELQAYLSAIYAQAPYLKPEQEEQK